MPYTSTPRTWVAGEVPTATHFNDNLRDFARGFTDAWTSYTPTLTASTTNPTNWTQTGYYARVGKLVIAKGTLTAGASMTAGSGTYRIALPVNAQTALGNAVLEGSTYLYDNSTGNAYSIAVPYAANTAYIQLVYGTGGTGAIVGHNAPWTWAASDIIQFAFSYEAA
jgi:hypothetical protein